MTNRTNRITPRDWQIQAQAEAADGYAAKIAEAKRYGAMADALEALQAENARLTKECDSFEVANIAVAFERDKALARLAESEAQNLMARQIILEHGEGVAGASPVQPSQAQPPAPGEAAREYMTGYSDCKEWAQLSQDADPNAPWLSEAHMLCTDQGIAQGNITERIRALRDKLVQPSQTEELSDEEIDALWVLTPEDPDGHDFVLFARAIIAAIKQGGQ